MRGAVMIGLAVSVAVSACGEAPRNSGKPRYLAISAQGKAIGTPDAMRFTVTTRKVEETAEAALKATSTTMAGIAAKLKEAGVAEKDLKSKSAAVNPHSVCRPVPPPIIHGQHQICEPKGFKSHQVVTVLARDLSKAGSLMALAVANGAEEMQGGEPFFGDPEAMHQLARANAIESAQAKAQLYAQKLGLRLGPVVAVTDDPLLLPGLHREAMPTGGAADMGGAFAEIPVEPGQRVLSKTLYVTWELR